MFTNFRRWFGFIDQRQSVKTFLVILEEMSEPFQHIREVDLQFFRIHVIKVCIKLVKSEEVFAKTDGIERILNIQTGKSQDKCVII